MFVGAIFLGFSGFAQYIPKSTLAAILFVIAYGLVDWDYIRRVIRGSRGDTAVYLATFTATLCLPLSYAVFVGILLNLALYLRRDSQLHISEMVRTPAGPFEERPLPNRQGQRQVMFLQIEGDLFFGVADQLRDRLSHVEAEPVRVIIFRLKRTFSMDTAIINVLDRFTRDLQTRGGHVLLCGIKPELMRQLQDFGLVKTIGVDNVFPTDYGIFTSAKKALERAEQLIGCTLVVAELDVTENAAGWTYEI